MAVSLKFAMHRTLATRSAQEVMGSQWNWPEWTLADWDIRIAVMRAQVETVAAAGAAMDTARGDLDLILEQLHDRTVLTLTLLKVLHRNNSALAKTLKPLRARGDSRNSILQIALDLIAHWEAINPAWEPQPGQTRAAFEMLYRQGKAQMEIYAEAETSWSVASSDLIELAASLNRDCVAWYDVATTIFSAKTAEGRMIRGTVPTTYKADKPEEQPELLLPDVTDPIPR